MEKLKLNSGIFGQINDSWIIKYKKITTKDLNGFLSNKKVQDKAGKLIMENYGR